VGRHFEQNTAAADDGSADPALLAALTAFAAGKGAAADIVEAFRSARLLVPLLAHAGETGTTADGHPVDKTQELSITTVDGPDGRRVLPVFSSVETLAAWNPKARPVPAAGPRVALAAASEETELVVVDPTSPTEFVIRRPALFALATDVAWQPSYEAPAVLDAFVASVVDEPDARTVALAAGDPGGRMHGAELIVRLGVRPGLGREALMALVERVTARWAASSAIAQGVDSMTLQITQD
jgi:hypothetical protein